MANTALISAAGKSASSEPGPEKFAAIIQQLQELKDNIASMEDREKSLYQENMRVMRDIAQCGSVVADLRQQAESMLGQAVRLPHRQLREINELNRKARALKYDQQLLIEATIKRRVFLIKQHGYVGKIQKQFETMADKSLPWDPVFEQIVACVVHGVSLREQHCALGKILAKKAHL
ncbi:hypothetical protein EC988_003083 [Linderina pennispora]|nr:hypothetical protein EC988_003083 [Linderina pennispora]